MCLRKADHVQRKTNYKMTQDEFRPYLLFAMLCLMVVSVTLTARERAAEPVRFASKPVFSTDYAGKRANTVSQIIESGNYLYILPDDTKGFVQAYDLCGNYQHTLFFLEESNGVFTMAAEGNLFYVQNQSGDVYVFREGIFLEYVERKIAKDRFAYIGFVWQGSSPNYRIRGTDLYRIAGDKAELVIADIVRFNAQSATIILGTLVFIGMLWLFAYYLKRRRSGV